MITSNTHIHKMTTVNNLSSPRSELVYHTKDVNIFLYQAEKKLCETVSFSDFFLLSLHILLILKCYYKVKSKWWAAHSEIPREGSAGLRKSCMDHKCHVTEITGVTLLSDHFLMLVLHVKSSLSLSFSTAVKFPVSNKWIKYKEISNNRTSYVK